MSKKPLCLNKAAQWENIFFKYPRYACAFLTFTLWIRNAASIDGMIAKGRPQSIPTKYKLMKLINKKPVKNKAILAIGNRRKVLLIFPDLEKSLTKEIVNVTRAIIGQIKNPIRRRHAKTGGGE